MISKNALMTIEYAGKLAQKLSGGEVIGLIGDLGSGKTTFTKGLAETLKVSETVNSPTFVLLKDYPAKIKDHKIHFVHVDAYRVENIEDIKSVGIEDYLNRDDVILVIEWAEKITEILPQNTILIKFKTLDEKTRQIKIQK